MKIGKVKYWYLNLEQKKVSESIVIRNFTNWTYAEEIAKENIQDVAIITNIDQSEIDCIIEGNPNGKYYFSLVAEFWVDEKKKKFKHLVKADSNVEAGTFGLAWFSESQAFIQILRNDITDIVAVI